ncbi:MAG: tyrosine--tRNA ligase [Hadesarchaea archaeon DG-33-1]|nr:MAG: tyrosine--tRNA ligase [Hadesarchaea archaeon DG-33-1]
MPGHFSGGGRTSPKEKLELATRGIKEVVTEHELRELLKGKDLTIYCGYEPSGKIHFGHAITVRKLVDFQKFGAKAIVLLADLHAYLNDKGSLEEIRRIADYNRHCFIALGLDEKRTEFILGSSYQLEPKFSMDVLRMAVGTTLMRARRSMATIARHLKNPDVAQVLYPLMQVVDIAWLNVDVAVGGIDQRKVHMVAREKLPTLGYRKPVCVHVPLLHGLDSAAKMSSSKGNFIAIDDEPTVIEEKVKKAFCPPKVVKDNPVIEYAEHVVFPALGSLRVKRSTRYGGPLEVNDPHELRKLYVVGKLHPADLKAGVASAVIELLAPVRQYFEEHPGARPSKPSSIL